MQAIMSAVYQSDWCKMRSMWLAREWCIWSSCIKGPIWSCKRRPKSGVISGPSPQGSSKFSFLLLVLLVVWCCVAAGNWPEMTWKTLWDALAALAAVSATSVSSSKSRGSPIGGASIEKTLLFACWFARSLHKVMRVFVCDECMTAMNCGFVHAWQT